MVAVMSMKENQDKRNKTLIKIGLNLVPFPGIPYIIRGAVSTQNMPPACDVVPASSDTVLYVFTPMRIRIDAPDKPWLPCRTGTAILMPNHNRYVIDTTVTKRLGHHCWFTLEDIFLDPLYQCVQNQSGMARFLDPDGSLGIQIQALVALVEQKRAAAFWPLQHKGGHIMERLRAARRLEPGVYQIMPETHKSRPISSFAPRVMDYLRANMSTALDLKTIAEALHVSKSMLSHTYRQEMGESALQTLRRMRLHQVKMLLTQDRSLDAIAELTGFYDGHHVSREFMRSEGIRPSVFLQRIRKNQQTANTP